MIALVWFVYRKQDALWLSNNIIIGLALVGILHILGGGFSIGGTRIYDLHLFYGLQFDNLVHGVGTFVITFVGYNLLEPHVHKHVFQNKKALVLILLLIALGIGSLNELAEFVAVLLFDAGTRVGDYYNTGWDIVSNTVGSLIAIAFVPPFKENRLLVKIWRKLKH